MGTILLVDNIILGEQVKNEYGLHGEWRSKTREYDEQRDIYIIPGSHSIKLL